MRDHSFIGVGEFAIGPTGGALTYIGNVSAANLAPQQETRELQDFTRPGGGLRNSVSRITGVNLDLTLTDFAPSNLALVLAGTNTDVASGTVTDEAITALGELILLPHTDLSAVTVTSDPVGTTYTDFEVTAAGIRPTAGGDLATAIEGAAGAGVPLLVGYSYGAHAVIEALTQSGQEWRMVFDGLNDAQSGQPVVINMHRVKLSPTSGLALITAQNFGELPISGRLLADNTQGAGLSRYVQIRQKVLT